MDLIEVDRDDTPIPFKLPSHIRLENTFDIDSARIAYNAHLDNLPRTESDALERIKEERGLSKAIAYRIEAPFERDPFTHTYSAPVTFIGGRLVEICPPIEAPVNDPLQVGVQVDRRHAYS